MAAREPLVLAGHALKEIRAMATPPLPGMGDDVGRYPVYECGWFGRNPKSSDRQARNSHMAHVRAIFKKLPKWT